MIVRVCVAGCAMSRQRRAASASCPVNASEDASPASILGISGAAAPRDAATPGPASPSPWEIGPAFEQQEDRGLGIARTEADAVIRTFEQLAGFGEKKILQRQILYAPA